MSARAGRVGKQVTFTATDLAWLAESQGFSEPDLEALRRLRFTSDVWAVPESTAVFVGEPLVEVGSAADRLRA